MGARGLGTGRRAIGRASRRRWWLTLAVAALVGVVGAVMPGGALAGGNAGVKVMKTVDSTSITPALSLTLAVSQPAAIPGDHLTYSGQVSNTGSSLGMTGHFTGESHASTTSNVASYFDEVEVCSSVCSSSTPVWTALAGFAAVQAGYTPVETPGAATGLTLTATPVTAFNVTYPASGDPILGTQIGPSAVGNWAYQAAIALTPSQIATLSDPTKVQAIRNTFHMEVTPRNEQAAQPWDDSVVFTNPFQAGANPAAVTRVTVTITPPNGAPVVVDSTSVPGLALVKPGDVVPYSAAFTVPVPAVKGTAESDAAYLARLTALEGAQLQASAVATGTGPSGSAVSAPAPPAVSSAEHLPILGITKSGPTTLDAGTTESNPLAIVNSGGAPASAPAVADNVPGGAAGTVSGLPASLAPSGTASATASFPVPVDQPSGSLTDTAALTWQDANGNVYGPVSSSFTTTVHNPLLGARLTLAPTAAGPDIAGQSQGLTATLVDAAGAPIAGQNVAFAVTGANPTSGGATTSANGSAAFSYVGTNTGTDQVQATVHAASITLQSNTSSVGWIKPIQTISSTTVQGTFFHEDPANTIFVAKPGDTPDFGQTFPTIDFNPLPGTVPHDISGVTNQTRPFTDLTTDAGGNFNGTIVAQGNGVQAGVGTMVGFDAVFTGTYVVSEAGDVTLNLTVGDGFILGVGGGAMRVSGDLINPPASGTTVFQGYPVMAAFQQQSAAAGRTATIHFPAPGSYPYELDYFEAGGGDLSLVVTAASIVPQTNPLSIYVGYADGLRPAGSVFPFPWLGSPGVTFAGDTRDTFDSGALRFDNSSAAAITLDSVTVDIGSVHFDLWPHGLTVPAQQTLVLAQTNNQNFDTSDFPIQCGGNNGVIPVVNVTIGGVLQSFRDTHQVLNTGGIDPGGCGRNESESWQRIAGTASPINVPLPPAVNLNLSPFTIPGATVGLTQKLTVTAMDGSGLPVSNQPLTIQVFGANAQQLTATTDSGGIATFSYTGANQGVDQVQASGFVTGFRAVSNLASVTWTNPIQPGPNPQPSTAPPPSVTAVSPADGVVVTEPVPVTATITPPSGQSIASWQVTYQAHQSGPVVTLASGTGAPPSPLATFDPTLLPNDSYQIDVTAIATNGVGETETTTVTVFGTLKLGHFVTSYQDLSVPVNGFQMQVRRTYDSFDKGQGDFGIGWRVDVVNFRTASNRPLGAGGWSMYDTSCVFGICLTAFRSSAPHYVSVTFPDRHTEIFDFTPSGGTNVFWSATAAYTARTGAGTTSTLAPVDGGALTYRGDGNLYDVNGQAYDPQRFKLTTRDGRVLTLDRTTGLVSETDPSGNSLTIDASGIHSTSGGSITFARDSSGRITQVTGPSGEQLGYSYSATGDLVSYTNAVAGVSTYQYDGQHDLLHADAASASTASFTNQYDSQGRLISVTDGSGHVTQISADIGARTQTVADPNGSLITVYSFDALGELLKEERIAGGTSQSFSYTYDPLGDLLTATDPTGATSTLTYDSAGDVVSAIDPNKNTTRFTYDGNGRLLTTARPDGTVDATLSYDAAGRLVSLTRADGSQTTYTYDGAGRPVSSSSNRTGATTIGYTPTGSVAQLTKPDGSTASLTYDASGRLLSVSGPLGVSVSFQHDALGDLTQMSDAAGHSQSATYDQLGRLSGSSDNGGHTSSITYDAAGRIASITDALGVTATYQYDADGHLASKSAGSSVQTFTYDPFGRLATAVDGAATVSFGYDGAGRETSQTESGASLPTTTVTNQYDGVGNLVQVGGPQGTITRGYDVNGRLTSVQDGLGTTQLSYDSGSRLVSLSRPNGAVDQLAYDAAGRLTTRSTSVRGTLVDSLAYTYAASGAIASLTENGDTASFTRDAVGRLIGVQHSSPGLSPESFSYDSRNNRLSWSGDPGTYSYGQDDQLASSPSASFAYDAAGQRTGMTTVSGTTGYSWTPNHQLAQVTGPDGAATSFQYDALGRLVAVNDGSKAKALVYDGDQVLAEYDNGSLASTFTPGAAVDRPLSVQQGGQGFYYLQDQHGNVTNLLDSSGSVAQSYNYSAFGAPTAASGNVGNPFTWSALQYDPRAQAYYDRARYYDPRNGVFLSRDPAPALNPYSFAGGDPVDFGDPSGAELTEYTSILKWDVELGARATGCIVGVFTTFLSAGLVTLATHGSLDLGTTAVDAGIACGVGFAFPSFGRVLGTDPTDAAYGSLVLGWLAYMGFSALVGFLFGFITDVINQVLCGKGINWSHAFWAGAFGGVAGVVGGFFGAWGARYGQWSNAVLQIGSISIGSVFGGLQGAFDPGPCG